MDDRDDRFAWIDRGTEQVLWLDAPGSPGARYLAIRQVPAEGDETWWQAVCQVQPGRPEQEIGDGLPGAGVAQDAALKFAIQALAQLHGVSPAPGMPEPSAPEAERDIARLWKVITDRWAAGVPRVPRTEGDEGEG